ncbi:MAG: FAD binding domain-containing protein [Chloroflexota bacterium]|nr:FAD binding domain-containing protein [Chloroflexota bacterium]
MPISNIASYHRPDNMEVALRLLREGEGRAVPMAGGTALVGHPPREVEAVVDLRNLRLDWIRAHEDGTLTLGATTTLNKLMTDEVVRDYGNGILAEAVRYTAGSLIRNRATLGGTLIARAATSDLVAVLLAVGASVVVRDGDQQVARLEDFYRRRDDFLRPGMLLTEVRLPTLTDESRLALHRVARTPMDQPILTVAALVTGHRARIAANGFGDGPALLIGQEQGFTEINDLDSLDAAIQEAVEGLEIKGDQLASAEYRRAMLPVLVRRAIVA